MRISKFTSAMSVRSIDVGSADGLPELTIEEKLGGTGVVRDLTEQQQQADRWSRGREAHGQGFRAAISRQNGSRPCVV